MAEMSASELIVKLGLGAGVGFGLYLLISNLRLGGGFGFGGDDAARGEGAGPTPSGPPVPPPPPIPRDDRPILLWVEGPEGAKRSTLPDPTSRTREDARFLMIDLAGAKTLDELNKRLRPQIVALRDKSVPSMSLDEAIAQIKAGGRDDVRLMTSGATRQGTWDDAKDALMAAGIKHWLLWKEAPADRKPGQPAKPPKWELFDKSNVAGNPLKNGHYLVENRGTDYWNLENERSPAPHVSGGRGRYAAVPVGASIGRGHYWSYRR